MIPDVFLDGKSMVGLGWLRETVSFPVPKSQTNTIIVPGRNSPIRYTEALGQVSYQPRSFSITLTMLGTRERFNRMVTPLANLYAGKLTEVITSEDPGLYCIGTLQMEATYAPLTGKGQVVISCEDGDAYRYHTEETIVSITGSGTVLLENDYMSVVPTVTTTAETALSWTVGNDTFRKTLSAGTWTLPELELFEGANTVQIQSSGATTFRYREGCL